MRIEFQGDELFISTGGRAFDKAGPVMLFIHGSGQSHLTFMQQGRYFANRGWQVLNPDMPAHGLSGGAALTSIEDMADFYAALLTDLGVEKAHIVGHSQGCLVALELARRHSGKVEKICFVAGALAIPVNDALLDMAEKTPPKAYQAMVNWAHGTDSHLYDHSWPGHTHIDFGNKVMAQNHEAALSADLQACNNYQEGAIAAKAVQCPTMAILAEKDKMTPIKFGTKLADEIENCDLHIISDAGHFLPSERPYQVNQFIRSFMA